MSPRNCGSTEAKSISFEPINAKELSRFFEINKDKYHEILIILTKKKHANPQPVSFTEAVAEAKKHGLIDSRTQSLDDQRYYVRFTKRKATHQRRKLNF